MGVCVCNRQKGNLNIYPCYSPVHFSTRQADIHEYYKFEKVIGSGTFGIVRVGNSVMTPEERVAIKSISKRKFKKRAQFDQFRCELDILRSLDHPNILRFYESFEDSHYIHLVTEYCEGGDLFDRLSMKGQFSELEASKLMQSMLRAVHHLHQNGICHRDIKPENFLFVSENSENSDLKLIDFGLSKKFSQKPLKTIVGSIHFVAPEVLEGKSYSYKCDIWGLGVILYALLSGTLPFLDRNAKHVFDNMTFGIVDFSDKSWDCVSLDAKEFILQLLKIDPKERITTEQAFEHCWFRKLNHQLQIESTGIAEPEFLGTDLKEI